MLYIEQQFFLLIAGFLGAFCPSLLLGVRFEVK
jgi:hypothetical protein